MIETVYVYRDDRKIRINKSDLDSHKADGWSLDKVAGSADVAADGAGTSEAGATKPDKPKAKPKGEKA